MNEMKPGDRVIAHLKPGVRRDGAPRGMVAEFEVYDDDGLCLVAVGSEAGKRGHLLPDNSDGYPVGDYTIIGTPDGLLATGYEILSGSAPSSVSVALDGEHLITVERRFDSWRVVGASEAGPFATQRMAVDYVIARDMRWRREADAALRERKSGSRVAVLSTP